MIMNIPVDGGKEIKFDTMDPPMASAFDELLQSLSGNSIASNIQHNIAYAYRRHPCLALKVLEQLDAMQSGDSNTKLLLLACQVQLGMDSADLLQRMEPFTSPAFDILKGFSFLRRKSYESALFLFKKARFRLGIHICSYYLNNIEEAKKSDNRVVRAYCLIKENNEEQLLEAVKLLREEGKINILFRLGFSDEYESDEPIDVKMTLAEKRMDEGRFDESREILRDIPENAEVLYLKGKLEHKLGNLEKAKRCFMESLEHDTSYFKSKYNLQRILQERIEEVHYPSSEFSDFKTYLKLRNGETDISLTHCSKEFRDVASAIMEGKKGGNKGLGKYLKVMGNSLIDNYVVMNNISYFLCRHMIPFEEVDECKDKDRLLVDLTGTGSTETNSYVVDGVRRDRRTDGQRYLSIALAECPDEYKDVIEYNLGYVTEDRSMLARSPFKEAKLLMMNKAEKEEYVLPTEPELLGHYYMKRREFKLAKKILQRLDTPYACIAMGNIYIRNFYRDQDPSDLDMAIKTFSRKLHSYYCANGIGICLALKGRLEDAINTFTNVTTDWNGAYVNLGNTLVLSRRYEDAVDAFMRISSMKYAREMVVGICKLSKDVECCRRCVSAGIDELREYLFELLVEKGFLEEARRLEVKDERLVRIYEEKREIEEKKKDEIRRRMDEISEYRKKRNI